MIEQAQVETKIKKPKRRYFSVIFWLALIIFTYFSGKYLLIEFDNKQAKDKSGNQLTNVTTDISKPVSESAQVVKGEEKTLNQNEILLKQQLQISELQNNFNALKTDLERLKTNDNLSKIILNFVKLKDSVELKQNYNSALQKLELLARADFALSGKIEKLKLVLQNQPKNNEELKKEFTDLIPQIKAKQIEIESKGSWFGKIKASIAKFVTIRKTGENSAKNDLESLISNVQNHIKNRQYSQALNGLANASDYQEILINMEIDLQNANSFEQISDEIYKYLEALSNN